MGVMQYLDDRGFRTLARLLSFGRKKIWHGTRPEWDALPEEERAKYDQAEVKEEAGNNGNGVVYVADKVEAGNYNPVTSNAVAEKLNYTVTVGKEELTGRTWIDGLPIYRQSFSVGFNTASDTDRYTIQTKSVAQLGPVHVVSIVGTSKVANGSGKSTGLTARYIPMHVISAGQNNATWANFSGAFVDEDGEVFVRTVMANGCSCFVTVEYTKQEA